MTPGFLASTFVGFGREHLVALGVIVLAAAWLAMTVRKGRLSPSGERYARLGLFVALASAQGLWHGLAILDGSWRAGKYLPLQLCDAAVAANLVALLRPRWRAVELAWFWGLGGAVQALLTPDIAEGAAHGIFWIFFVTHGVIVVAPVLLVIGRKPAWREGAVVRAFVATNLVAIAAGAANLITGGNFMFLREPPPGGSLLDHLGPWPWYIAAGELLACGLFFLLDRLAKVATR